MSLAPGITKAGEGRDNIAWNILGQTYGPKEVCVEKGRIVWRGSADGFRSEPSIVERFLHVGGAPAPTVL